MEWLLIEKDSFIRPVIKTNSSSNIRSQDATSIYSPSGNAYAVNKEYFFKNNTFIGPKSLPYLIENKDELIDIDNKYDFEQALKSLKNNNQF